MNKLICFLTGLSFCLGALADDTEIYGSTAIDPENSINSNVLFIMDTSGSMDIEVTSAHTPYDKDFPYTGLYTSDHVYKSNDANTNAGYPIANMKSGCSNEVIDLLAIGKRFDRYQQNYGRNWGPLGNDTSKDIRCDQWSGGYSDLLYTGHYLNWFHSVGATESTRIKVVVDVVKELTHSLSNINLGLMRFDRYADGGMIDVAVSDIETSGPLIRAKLAAYEANGNTPLEETMYEAARYYRGETWKFGNNSSPNISVNDSRISNGSTYKSPIDASCQKNHIILLTDGAPTSDTSANSSIRTLVNSLALPAGLSKECSGNGQCMDELAYWMRNTDHASDQAGDQDITVYTIGGFNLASGVELLKRTANWGGGRYYPADDTQGLINALDSIFLNILATDSTFTAPAVSVNAFNASEHRDELFYALFRPADNIKWTGNLKKYKLLSDGTVVGKDTAIPAISLATGYFNESVYDYWNDSGEPDGKDVSLGGMANKLTSTRNILTNKDNNEDLLLPLYSSLTFDTDGTSFAIADETTFDNVLKWSRGIDVLDENGDGDTSDSRQSIGDPLHSEPVIITYGGNEENPISNIFFGTNEGFIHSLDTVTGQESFAFIPKELHATQKIYFDNTAAAAAKPYGMDGPISTWFYDKNGNNLLNNTAGDRDTGEHVYLYAGMRRGGDNYYALDVSNRTTPTLKFVIEGGAGDFTKLGQTWSKMTPAKVRFDNQDKFVLFFTGGYDTNQDSNTVRVDDTIGNAIYMVDASNGDLLWWSSNLNADLNIETMTNSMPASISAVDITGDGFINYLFAADTGGRVFRIDIKQDNTGKSNFAQGGEIASLAGDDATNNRRFYNKPNVALVKDKQYGDYLTIAIGSGYRAHPILTKNVKNRFYMIKDYNPYAAPTTYTSVSEAPLDKISLATSENADPLKLYNASALMTDGDIALTSEMQVLMNNGAGWYVEMKNEGEKVLAQSTTFSGAIIFTSFAPSTVASSSSCGADTGTSRTYAISQKLAMAVIDLDGDGDTDNDDASKILAHSGIAPRPVVIYRPGGGKTIAIGTETIDDNRFDTDAPAADDPCIANGTCEEASKCETGNCYVNPVYWRQNDQDLIAPQE